MLGPRPAANFAGPSDSRFRRTEEEVSGGFSPSGASSVARYPSKILIPSGFDLPPLVGEVSAGQAEIAASTSISARRSR